MTRLPPPTHRTLPRPSAEAVDQSIDWDAVYADLLPRIYNYLRFRVGRDADAEDLASRTFLGAVAQWRRSVQAGTVYGAAAS
jgi:DNA-directed RNA polymerase specialized sigma24 family protein